MYITCSSTVSNGPTCLSTVSNGRSLRDMATAYSSIQGDSKDVYTDLYSHVDAIWMEQALSLLACSVHKLKVEHSLMIIICLPAMSHNYVGSMCVCV